MRRSIGLSLSLALLAMACGGSPSTSGVDGSKRAGTLPLDEYVALCDWVASLYGGYGMRRVCSNGSYSAPAPSQQACIDGQPALASCEATVGEFELCVRALHDRCTGIFTEPRCASIVPCSTLTQEAALRSGAPLQAVPGLMSAPAP